MNIKLKILFVVFIAFVSNSYSQLHYIDDAFGMRVGSTFSHSIKYQEYRTGRFIPILSKFNLNRWVSSKTLFYMDQLPINITLLNLNSPDLLPLNLLINKIPNQQHSNLKNQSINSINITTIAALDKPTISFRGYLGSQTGDQLIHLFTRDGIEARNINKIPPSGEISISNIINNWGYALSAGYYGFFSTGSENDKIISNTNNYYYNKLNKQILTSGNFFYRFKNDVILCLDLSFMSYYGWDIPPFITSFVHLENYFHRFQLSFKNLFGSLNLYLKNDGSQSKINPGKGILPSNFLQSEYSLYGLWNLDLSKFNRVEIAADINLYQIKNLLYSNEYSFQNFFNEEKDFYNYGLSGKYLHLFSNTFQSLLSISYEKQNLMHTFSASIKFEKQIFKNITVKFYAESYAYAPNVTEIYGNFTRYVLLSNYENEMHFSIKGNSYLSVSRSNKISFDFNYKNSSNLLSEITINPFFELVQDPIEQSTFYSVRIKNTKEILRDAQYINGNGQKLFGSYFLIKAFLNNNILFQNEFQIVDNKESEYIPKFKSRIDIILSLSKFGNISASWFYRTKSYWSEFIVSNENDYYLETGFDGLLTQVSIVSFYYDFKLNPFYIFNYLHFKISLENVFNNKQKYLPIGNSLNRTFVFSIAGEL